MLAQQYGCKITGLDATAHMIDEANKRTKKAGLTNQITYKLGNALDIPYKSETFDIIWGQDAWCYTTDKDRLIQEAHRVLKPQGYIAFTDWLQVGTMTPQEWTDLNSFMAFPYMETLEGYTTILKTTGFNILETEDLSPDFTQHCHQYQTMLRTNLKDGIIKKYGPEMFEIADNGLNLWVQAADQGKVGRGRLIAQKT
jgi:ubiquinone/menaquinone biosynthesis C-methylase UbiE